MNEWLIHVCTVWIDTFRLNTRWFRRVTFKRIELTFPLEVDAETPLPWFWIRAALLDSSAAGGSSHRHSQANTSQRSLSREPIPGPRYNTAFNPDDKLPSTFTFSRGQDSPLLDAAWTLAHARVIPIADSHTALQQQPMWWHPWWCLDIHSLSLSITQQLSLHIGGATGTKAPSGGWGNTSHHHSHAAPASCCPLPSTPASFIAQHACCDSQWWSGQGGETGNLFILHLHVQRSTWRWFTHDIIICRRLQESSCHIENKWAIIGFSVRGKCRGCDWYQNFLIFFANFWWYSNPWQLPQTYRNAALAVIWPIREQHSGKKATLKTSEGVSTMLEEQNLW